MKSAKKKNEKKKENRALKLTYGQLQGLTRSCGSVNQFEMNKPMIRSGPKAWSWRHMGSDCQRLCDRLDPLPHSCAISFIYECGSPLQASYCSSD